MNLYFQKLGNGPAIIFLHGLYGSSDNWITVGRKLADKFTVYLVDQRNHGRSGHQSEHTYVAMVNDLEELYRSESIEKAIILGHSMGGKTAMLFSAIHPEKVAGLVVVDIAPSGYTSLDNYSPHSIFHLNLLTTMLSIDFSKVSSRGEIDAELAKMVSDVSIRQFIMKNVHRNVDNSFCWKLNATALSKALPEILGEIPLEKTIANQGLTQFPILFIKGELSDYITEEQIPSIQKFFPKAEITTIKGAGHWVHAEQPLKFMETLEKFLLKV